MGVIGLSPSPSRTFPDLRKWEDSEVKITAAKQAVAEVKTLIKQQDEKARNEREIEAANRTAATGR